MIEEKIIHIDMVWMRDIESECVADTHCMYIYNVCVVGVFPSHHNNAKAYSTDDNEISLWFELNSRYEISASTKHTFSHTQPRDGCELLRVFVGVCAIERERERVSVRKKHEMRYAMCVTSIHFVLPMHTPNRGEQ